jgi:hypothetical protein
MKTHELLAMICPGKPEGTRLQALQVLAVRSAVMIREQQVSSPTPSCSSCTHML